jgi:hypothetical protein
MWMSGRLGMGTRMGARVLVAAALGLVAGVAVQAPASAEPVPKETFRAELDAAVEATGVFVRGSTILLETRNSSTNVTVSMAVNPDGSLVWTEQGPKSDYVLKCVRVDRCWALSRVGYGDAKWHRLPAGAVAYEQTRTFWAEWTAYPWPETASYVVAPTPEGARAFSVISNEPDLSLVQTTVVDGTSIVDTVFLVGADNSLVPSRSVVMLALPEPEAIAPPARRKVGRPLSDGGLWRAVINS